MPRRHAGGAVPPQNLEAEEFVLGAMLISAGAIEACSAVVRPDDFYRPSHSALFAACVELYGRGEAVDAITVCDELAKRGQLEGVGGADRVHTLAALVPSTANAPHYARIVQEISVLRGLIRVGEKVAVLGWERPGESDELLERASQLVFGLTSERQQADFVYPSETVPAVYARISELAERGSGIVGLPTGFHDLDKVTSGLAPGNLIVIAARPSIGKRLRLDAPVLTPRGWRRNGDLHPGDLVIGADGRPDSVLAVHDEPEPLPFYRVTFEDGASVECCGDHLWLTRTRNERRAGTSGQPRTTEEIRATVKRPDGHGWNHTIPYVEPVEFERLDRALPLDPYWLGLYLGDGGTTSSNIKFTNPEEDLRRAFAAALPEGDVEGASGGDARCPTVAVKRAKRNNRPSTAYQQLAELGLAGVRSTAKFIPWMYLRASALERLALLQGLCDTDGYVTGPKGACIEISTSSSRLRDGIMFLVGSLGGSVSCTSRPSHYQLNGVRHEANESHRIVFAFPRGEFVPVRSVKHLRKWRSGPHARGHERAIVSVEPCGVAQGRCITVGRGLYVTDGFSVTHNSSLALGIVNHVAVHLGLPVCLFTLEMTREEVTQRLLAIEGLVEQQRIRNGTLDAQSEDWDRLARAAGVIERAPLAIHDASSVTLSEIRAKARRLKSTNPALALIVVDYLQLLTSGGSEDSRVQEVSTISRSLKVLAGDLGVPVIALSQLSRAVEQRHDKRPLLSDLRDSGSIEQDADLVWFIYRDDYYNEESISPGVAEVAVAKNRNGPTEVVKLTFVKRHARFSDLRRDGDLSSGAF